MAGDKMVLDISNLSKQYGKKQVLAPTDLTIYDGECVVLCGGNGAGKSTLIKLITGIEKATTGRFEFTVDNQKKFGFMPDQMYFSPELTATEVLRYYANFLGVKKDKIDYLLKKVGLWDERNQRIESFSKGMSQRINLAQALLAEADVYIFDEPTNGLDPYWVIEFKKIIQELKQSGKTVILSSHIMRDVVEISDRVIILFEGEVKENGGLNDIYERQQCNNLEDVFLSILHKEQQKDVSDEQHVS